MARIGQDRSLAHNPDIDLFLSGVINVARRKPMGAARGLRDDSSPSVWLRRLDGLRSALDLGHLRSVADARCRRKNSSTAVLHRPERCDCHSRTTPAEASVRRLLTSSSRSCTSRWSSFAKWCR